MISAIPFIMLMTASLCLLLPTEQAHLVQLITEGLPLAFHPQVTTAMEALYRQSSLSLVSATALSAWWAASRSLFALAGGLREIYGTQETRHYITLRIIALFHTLVLLISLLCSLVLLVFGNTLQLLLEEHLPQIARISGYLVHLRTAGSVTILSLIFALMYQVLSRTKNGFRHQLPGAVFSSLGWMIFSLAYALYLDHFSKVSYLYGSLTAIVLFMLWLYICMNLFLMGAQINVWLLDPDPWERIP